MKQILAALSDMPQLESLSIGHNGWDISGAKALAEFLVSGALSGVPLGFWGCLANVYNVNPIPQKNTTTLKDLSISWCNLRRTATAIIANAIAQNRGLEVGGSTSAWPVPIGHRSFPSFLAWCGPDS